MFILRALVSIILLGIGSCLIYFHEEIISEYDKRFGEKDPRPVVATLMQPEGVVRYKLPKTLIYKNARDGLSLRLKDTITTDSNSKLKVQFIDGLELEIEENSFIVLDAPSNDSTEGLKISFLRGNFKVLKRGAPGKNTLIKESGNPKDDIVIDPAAQKSLKPIVIAAKPQKEFKRLLEQKQKLLSGKLDEATPEQEALSLVDPNQKIDVNKSDTDLAKPDTRQLSKEEMREKIKKIQFKTREEKDTLPESYIVDVIKKQKAFFNRCYAQHLRLNPDAQGRIDFSFTINPKGKVIDVRILRSTLNDPRLQQCSMSVIERSEFRVFNGDPIVVNYPIFFE